MKSKTKKKIPIVIGGLGFLILAVYLLGNDTINTFDSDTFSIPPPEDFTGATSTNINPQIFCKIKSTGSAVDSAGNTLTNFQSSLLQGNPLLELTDANYNSMAGYVQTVKMWCENHSSTTVVVPADSLSMILHSNDPNGVPILTASKTFTTKSLSFSSGTTEQTLGYASVYASEIENKLPTTPVDYLSSQKFQIVGNLNIHWQGYSGIKYDIPISPNQVVSYHKARIVNEDTNLDVSLADNDNDGIINQYDVCPNDRETFNSFEDGDGCPDSAPTQSTQTDDPTPEEPITQTSCNADNKTWYKKAGSLDYCGTGYVYGGSVCDVYNVDQKECDGVDTQSVDTPISSNDALIGKMLWQIDVRNADGAPWAFLTTDDVSPFSFEVPLNNLSGGKSGGENNQISTITAQGMIKINDEGQHALTDTKTSDVNYLVTVQVNDQWVTVKEQKASAFIPRNGASNLAGMSIGTIEIRVAEIETKILETLGSTFTGTEKVTLKITANGHVGLDYNDGGVVKELDLSIVKSSCGTAQDVDGDGFCSNNVRVGFDSGDTTFVWTNLSFTSGSEKCADVNNNGICDAFEVDDKPPCKSYENLKASSVINGDVTYVCVPKGTTSDDNLGGQCTVGDTSVGCEICTDDGSGVGGFPCTLDYRSTYCNDTNSCGTVGDDGSEIVDPTDVNSSDNKQCPNGSLNTLDLSNTCLTVGDKSGASAGGSDDITCTGNLCTTTSEADFLNLILYGGIGAGILGLIIFILKRKR